MNKIMTSEEKHMPEFNVQDMINKVVNKYITRVGKEHGYVLFEEPIYEKVNDKLWYIYFTSKSPEAHWGKRFYQLVMGFGCIEEYYFNSNITDVSHNDTLDDLKIRFRNYLNMLLEDSKEVEEPLDEPDYDHIEWSDDDYNQMAAENEAAEQLAHELNRTDYIDAHPEYVLASTSDLVEETMVFPSNAEGKITSYSDLACLALRYGNDDWEDAIAAVITLNTDEYKYIHVKTLDNGGNNIHNLFKRITVSDNVII